MPTRTTLREEVLEILDGAVLEIGAKLDAVFENYPDFDQWVIENLPIQPRTAERIRAMYHVHLDKNGHRDLPEPHKALWSID